MANAAESIRDLVGTLYTRYLLRDFIAKALPGAIFSVASASQIKAAGILPPEAAQEAWKWLQCDLPWFAGIPLWLGAYGVSFAVGMLLQSLGMALRLTAIPPWPVGRHEFVTAPTWMRMGLRRALDLSRADRSWEVAFDFFGKPRGAEAYIVRERLTILKEMAGNFGVAILTTTAVLMLGMAYRRISPSGGLLFVWAVMLVVGAALCVQNKYHAYEQAKWEALVLASNAAPDSSYPK